VKKYFLIICVSLIITFSLGSTTLAADFVLNCGMGNPKDNPMSVVADQFADWVYEQTNGRVEINNHYSESLGSDREMMESVIMGTLDMSINSQGAVSIFDKRFSIFGLPFLFANMEEVEAILGGPFGERFTEIVNKDNKFKLLGFFDNGFRFVTNSVRPINEPKDLKGLKIRTPEDNITIAIFKSLGANPSPLAFGELYLALSQGLFDGQENPPVNIYYSHFYEVQKYLSKTGHKYEMSPFVISNAAWNKLPFDIQNIIKKGVKKFSKLHREVNTKLNNELLDSLREEGMEINETDKEKFVEATAGLYDQLKEEFPAELVEDLQAELDTLRK